MNNMPEVCAIKFERNDAGKLVGVLIEEKDIEMIKKVFKTVLKFVKKPF